MSWQGRRNATKATAHQGNQNGLTNYEQWFKGAGGLSPTDVGSMSNYPVPVIDEAVVFDESYLLKVQMDLEDLKEKAKIQGKVLAEFEKAQKIFLDMMKRLVEHKKKGATSELQMQKLKAEFVTFLHRLRPEFAKMFFGLQQTATKTDSIVNIIQNYKGNARSFLGTKVNTVISEQ